MLFPASSSILSFKSTFSISEYKVFSSLKLQELWDMLLGNIADTCSAQFDGGAWGARTFIGMSQIFICSRSGGVGPIKWNPSLIFWDTLYFTIFEIWPLWHGSYWCNYNDKCNYCTVIRIATGNKNCISEHFIQQCKCMVRVIQTKIDYISATSIIE